MMSREILGGDILQFHQRNCDRISNGESCSRAGGRSQIQRTRLARDLQVDDNFRKSCHRRTAIRGYRDDGDADLSDDTKEGIQLTRLAALAYGQNYVLFTNSSHIAMQRFAGVQKY